MRCMVEDGKVERWKNGEMKGWKDEKMERWKKGWRNEMRS